MFHFVKEEKLNELNVVVHAIYLTLHRKVIKKGAPGFITKEDLNTIYNSNLSITVKDIIDIYFTYRDLLKIREVERIKSDPYYNV